MKDIKIDRRYLGETVTSQNYRALMKEGGRELLRYHEKHLRAYLQGRDSFQHGWNKDEEGKSTTPKIFLVEQDIKVSFTNEEGKRAEANLTSQKQLNHFLKNKFGKSEK